MRCPSCWRETEPYCDRSLGGQAFECVDDDCAREWETDAEGEIIE